MIKLGQIFQYKGPQMIDLEQIFPIKDHDDKVRTNISNKVSEMIKSGQIF